MKVLLSVLSNLMYNVMREMMWSNKENREGFIKAFVRDLGSM